MAIDYVDTPEDILLSGPKYKLVLELLTQYPVLTYPRFFSLNTGLSLSEVYEAMVMLVSKGYKIRRIDGKGIVFEFEDLETAKQQLHAQFINDLLELKPFYSPYAIGYLGSAKYTFLKHPNWPSSIQNIVLIETEDGTNELLEFSEASLSFEVLAYCIQSKDHVITNLELYNLVQCLGINIEHYEYGAIYRWFDYCKNMYGQPFISINGLGWGLADPNSSSELQHADIELKLRGTWESYLINNIDLLPCTTIGTLNGYSFYFPNFTMGYLARHAFVIVKDLEGNVIVLDFNMQNTAKRMLELFVRNNGYVDKVIAQNATHEEWWQQQVEQEAQRSIFMNGSSSKKLKIVDVTTQDGYEYAIKRLSAMLEVNGLPSVTALPEVGYVVEGYKQSRSQYIYSNVFSVLKRFIHSYRSGLGIESGLFLENSFYSEYNLRFIIVETDRLSAYAKKRLFQPGLRKTHLAIFSRAVYINGDVEYIEAAVELTALQAQALRIFKQKLTVELNTTKREEDNIRSYFKSIEKIFAEMGLAFELNTGKVLNHTATLPVPTYKEN